MVPHPPRKKPALDTSVTNGNTIATTSPTILDPSPPSSPASCQAITRKVLEMHGYPIKPFLTTSELLRLSEVAAWLLPYRNLLDGLKIVAHPTNQGRLRGLNRLLGGQKAAARLRVVHRPALLTVIGSLRDGACPKLLILDLSSLSLDDRDARQLGKALGSGSCTRLQELDVGVNAITDKGFVDITKGLLQGNCTSLRRLAAPRNAAITAVGAQSLAESLRAHACPDLHHLDLCFNHLGPQGVESLALALQEGSCPEVRTLNLTYCGAAGGLRAIGEALRSGHCSKLEGLRLPCGRNSHAASGDVVSVVGALAEGACTNMQRLDLSFVNMSAEGARVLSEAIRSHYLLKLQKLELSGNSHFGDAGLRHLAEALRTNGCPNLRHLGLCRMGIGDDGIKALTVAIKEKACSKLQNLCVGGMPMGDPGVQALCEALKESSCKHLVNLVLAGTRCTEEGAVALGKALRDGACKRLEKVVLFLNTIGDKGLTELAVAMKNGGVPRLKVLDLRKTNLGDGGVRSLAAALAHGACPAMEELNLSMNARVTSAARQELEQSLQKLPRMKAVHIKWEE